MGDGPVWRFRTDGALREYATDAQQRLGVAMSTLSPDQATLMETGPG